MAEQRARLLKVFIQAEFVIDDGEGLTPWSGPVVEVAASQWSDFAAQSFGETDLALILNQFQTMTGANETPDPKE